MTLPGDPAVGLPEVEFSKVGPRVGEPFPDVVLSDQNGRAVDLHAYRGDRSGLVVVHRSADW